MDKDYLVPFAIALQNSFVLYNVIAMFGSDWYRTFLWGSYLACRRRYGNRQNNRLNVKLEGNDHHRFSCRPARPGWR